MFKAMWLMLIACGVSTCVSAAENVSHEKVESEIRRAGYECERVDGMESSIFGNEITVTCDRAYKFLIRYERGGTIVEVVS